VSVPVLTLQLAAAIEPAAGLVGKVILRAPEAEFARVQVPALSASVIVTVVPAPAPVAEQLL
jgi:hypothetical protein